MEDFGLIECSVNDNNSFVKNNTEDWLDKNNDDKILDAISMESPAVSGFGTIVVGVLLALLINAVLSFENDKLGDPVVKVKLSAKAAKRTIALLILILVLPLVLVFLFLAFLYKLACLFAIKRQDKRFVQFLDSFDVFWSLEDDSTKSIINILGIIESESSDVLLKNIKEKLYKIVHNEEADKIFYRRNEKYGFYYWRKFSHVDLDQYVQIVDSRNGDKLDNSDLEDIMSSISNKPLPHRDQGLFQILVTQQNLASNKDIKEYGLIFRIHHSVGDGVALVDFLCKKLADKDVNFNMFNVPETENVVYKSPTSIMNMIVKLCEVPICFVDGILRDSDVNSLHGPKLSGNKKYKWTNSEENLLIKIKELKENIGLRFSDVLAVALSNGLHDFLSKTMESIPQDVAVVVPVRFPKNSQQESGFKLENDFSVTILDIPIKQNPEHFLKVQNVCDKTRTSVDPLTNYYFLKIVSSILPKHILGPLLNSSQATMVFSNMPGPASLELCSGKLKSLVFFVPHKGTTGVGVTALCYGGKLGFAASADEALISNTDDLSLILQGMVDEINRLHSKFVVSERN